jgi:hypothetical protein
MEDAALNHGPMTTALAQLARNELPQYREVLGLFEAEPRLVTKRQTRSQLTLITVIRYGGIALEFAHRDSKASVMIRSCCERNLFQKPVPLLSLKPGSLSPAFLQQVIQMAGQPACLKDPQVPRSLEWTEFCAIHRETSPALAKPITFGNATDKCH